MHKCEVCGQELKSEKWTKSKRHINSRRHRQALKLRPTVQISEELSVFLAIKMAIKPKFEAIESFCSSVGVKTEKVVAILVNRIRTKDLEIKIEDEKELEKVIQDLVKLEKVEYPLSLSVVEAIEIFKSLNLSTPQEVVQYFSDLGKRLPAFVVLSSSRLGQPVDILTFKRVFPDQVTFFVSSRWDF